MKRFHVLLASGVAEDVGADEYQLHNGVLVFLHYQDFDKPPTVAIAYAQNAWIHFQEVSE